MIKCIVVFFPQVRDQLPHLKAIVQYKGELEQKLADVYTVSL